MHDALLNIKVTSMKITWNFNVIHLGLFLGALLHKWKFLFHIKKKI